MDSPSTLSNINGQNLNEVFDPKKDYYQTLEIKPDADKMEISRAYERLKKLYSEKDSFSKGLISSEENRLYLNDIEEAYKVISDPRVRLLYDNKRETHSSQAALVSYQKIDNENELKNNKEEKSKEENKSNSLQESIENLLMIGDHGDGGLYRKIRLLQNITEEEIQASTKVSITHISNIEENRFEMLPHTIYVKGFLKIYLCLLNIPSYEGLAQAYCKKLDEYRSE